MNAPEATHRERWIDESWSAHHAPNALVAVGVLADPALAARALAVVDAVLETPGPRHGCSACLLGEASRAVDRIDRLMGIALMHLACEASARFTRS